LGKTRRLDDAAGRYVEFCKSTFAADLTLKGLKIAVDAAHGAAYQIAPAVFHELGAEVVRIGCAPDGLNINREVGATHPQALIELVRQHGADYGVALDGDADRLQMVDGQGRLFNGDELLYLMVCERLERGEAVPGAVGTLMTNLAVELALKQRGVGFVRAKVGDRYVLEELVKRGWQLGGEGSGHLLVLDRHTTGDALVSALQVLQALRRRASTLSQCLKGAALFPQKMINVRLQAPHPWKASVHVEEAVRQVEAALGEGGRVLIRPSGTEPVVRVMVEASDAQLVDQCCHRLADVVAQG
jgi:phosphoglucosamine mutase